MLRPTLLALALPIAGIAAAQLTHNAPASTGQHMLEVNARWASMDPSVLLIDTRIAGYGSEADRIADHLLRVQAHLSRRLPAEISLSARSERTALLDTLRNYATRGIFPMNTEISGRSPVFIDELGNACAVGYLMIASGNMELAQRISREMNLAYVHDIALPELGTWAAANGFTADELAWIQPTYEYMRRDPNLLATVQLASGERFEVRSTANASDAKKLNLVRKGPNGDAVVAKLPLLSGVQAVEFAGRVFVGGMPPKTGSAAELYEWNGKALVAHDPFPGCMAIGSLNFVNGTLHVVGYELGKGEPQERYLTEAGDWKTVATMPTIAEPIHIEPEQRVP